MCSDAALLKILHAKAVRGECGGAEIQKRKAFFSPEKSRRGRRFRIERRTRCFCQRVLALGGNRTSFSLLENRCKDYRLFLTITQAVRYHEAVNRKQISKLAAALGKLGGSVKSKAKAKAARENGKKGGRPRKPKP
jgi:hypothetical protein